MAPLAIQKELDPHRIPKGDLSAPPPFIKLINRMTTKRSSRTCTFPILICLSSSKICCNCSLFFRSVALENRLKSSSSSFSFAAAAFSSSSAVSTSSKRATRESSSSSSSSSSSCSLAILVNSLSFVPSSLTLADPLSANMALVSVLYIRIAFFKVVYAVNESKATRETTKSASGSNLFKNAPIKAPAIVNGSMTKIKSQSTRGRSARGCLFFTFNMVLATAPPKTVMLESGMACLGEKPMTRM
mmetsp:Transcript_21527/g.40791  ORF Transcript_21527/g.40791 Transcript_21527/m.40791 type:complete len:244 (+) Transcript_21527:872-1603(+)